LKVNMLGLFLHDIEQKIMPLGMEKYRARQIATWIYQKGVHDFNLMTNLPKNVRKRLESNFAISTASVQARQQSRDMLTEKFLLAFDDASAIETVLMRHPYGNSVCVSTQVGCAMGCHFCASTLKGLIRDLTPGEILYQILYINDYLAPKNQKVNTIVIMGSGEPLANYDHVLTFIRLCHEPYCLNLSYRNITLSTSGLPDGIRKLADEGLPLNLAISLHAPNNTIRTKLMPINKRFPLKDVLAAGDYYAATTGRRVTYEYTLIAGINDREENAAELAHIMKKRLANVNLIPVNPVPERGLLRPAANRIEAFRKTLAANHIGVTVRREMGTDIQAACGQLRQKLLVQHT
jgi:23S rRNA (adenine2503-C2)-methyltransferase